MSDDTIQVKVQRANRGKATATLTFPDGTSYTDKLDLADAKRRAQFVVRAVRGKPGVTKAVKQDLAAALEKEATADPPGNGNRVSQADRLVLLTVGMEFFHSTGADPAAFVSFTSDGHRETWPVNSTGFKEFLARLYYTEHEKAPSGQAVADAVEGPVSASRPGSAIQLHPHATVVVDEAAASGLEHAAYYRHAWANKPDWQGI